MKGTQYGNPINFHDPLLQCLGRAKHILDIPISNFGFWWISDRLTQRLQYRARPSRALQALDRGDWRHVTHVVSVTTIFLQFYSHILLMEEIRLTSWGWELVPLFAGFYTCPVVRDYSHQQYYNIYICIYNIKTYYDVLLVTVTGIVLLTQHGTGGWSTKPVVTTVQLPVPSHGLMPWWRRGSYRVFIFLTTPHFLRRRLKLSTEAGHGIAIRCVCVFVWH